VPGCPHFGLHAQACGGCKMQHLQPAAQVAVKQRVLEDNLRHLAKVVPQQVTAAHRGPAVGLPASCPPVGASRREEGHRAGGFHERKSRYVADMTQCPCCRRASARCCQRCAS
jgi:23S rRNA (uracil1939-C5)-methyltransferase